MLSQETKQSTITPPKRRLLEIDFMRFSAAIAVVLYHYTSQKLVVDSVRVPVFPILEPITRYGYLGVDLFFMISGFVILLSSINRTPFEFVVSRVSRLYPGYWAAIFFTVAVVAIFDQSGNELSLFKLLMNLTMVNDYFDIKDIDGVYWTLHVELKFYFLIFALIIFRQIKYVEKWLFFWVSIVIIHFLSGFPTFLGWFIHPSYSSYFIAGATFYLILEKGISKCRLLLIAASYILSLANALERIEGFIHAEVLWFDQLITVIAITCFFILFGAISFGKTKFLRKNYFIPLGALTYPLYLIHNVAGKAVFNTMTLYTDKYSSLLVTLFFAVGGAGVIYVLVERHGTELFRIKLLQCLELFSRHFRSSPQKRK
jgi:peptidoglycan/LPS O-acetylase OafA/YrhL